VTYPLKLHDLSEIAVDKEFNQIKEKLGLQKIVNIPVQYLSSGEKQKVCIARALITKPEFVIADEPT
jgi:ABC-type lipoprotein export system ATPase subunit